MDEVGVSFRMNKCLLRVWEAMKGDVYTHFAMTKVDSLDSLCSKALCDIFMPLSMCSTYF